MDKDLDLSDDFILEWKNLQECCESILEYDENLEEATKEDTLPAIIDDLDRSIRLFIKYWKGEM